MRPRLARRRSRIVWCTLSQVPSNNPLGVYTLTPDRIRHLPEGKVAERRRAAEAERGARFRELYGMLGLRAAVSADGAPDVTVGATGETTKGVMPWNGSG